MANPVPQRDPGALAAQINGMLRLADAGSLAGSAVKLVLGAGVCLLMGFLFASFITGILVGIFNSSFISWGAWFGVYLAVLVPVLIWRDRRYREDYLANMLENVDPTPSSRGGVEMNRFAVNVGIVSAALAWGPRAIIDGIRGLQAVRSRAGDAVLARASALAAELAQSPGRVEVRQLLHPPEDVTAFGAAVDMLEAHGWIGKSSDGQSLWLNSIFRKKLDAGTVGQTRGLHSHVARTNNLGKIPNE